MSYHSWINQTPESDHARLQTSMRDVACPNFAYSRLRALSNGFVGAESNLHSCDELGCMSILTSDFACSRDGGTQY